MPHSWHYPIGPIMDRAIRLQPQTVMDIGIGYGKWGFLLRESLDWGPGRLDRGSWKTTIDGIEIFPYQSPLHDWVYDRIIWDDVLNVGDQIHDYDLILMNDVIEHLEKSDALRLLRLLVATNGTIIIATPVEFFTQEIAENEHEHHVSHWTIQDFSEFTYDYTVAGGAAIVVSIAGRDSTWPRGQDRLASRIAYHLPIIRSRPNLADLATKAIRRVIR